MRRKCVPCIFFFLNNFIEYIYALCYLQKVGAADGGGGALYLQLVALPLGRLQEQQVVLESRVQLAQLAVHLAQPTVGHTLSCSHTGTGNSPLYEGNTALFEGISTKYCILFS